MDSSASAGGLMIRSMPSSSRLRSASVTRHAISMRASRSMSSPVISQSIHTSRSFTLTEYGLAGGAWSADSASEHPIRYVLGRRDPGPQILVGDRLPERHRHRHHARPDVHLVVFFLVVRPAVADL